MAHPCVRISVLLGLKVLLDNQHAQVGGIWQGSWQGMVLRHSSDCSTALTASAWCWHLVTVLVMQSILATGPVKQYL